MENNITTLKNDRLIRALKCQPVDRTPVWVMRQAGRYLPEYRAIRTRVKDFLTLCKTPELACEVTLQPLARYPLDAAIVFSDILTLPDAMDLGLYFSEGEGPCFEKPVRTVEDVKRLRVPDIEAELSYVFETIKMARRELDGKVPLIGFSGSPWTMACYMVEGCGSKTFSVIKSLLYREPDTLHMLLNVLQNACIDYLNAQINAGAQALMIFDTWGGVLTPNAYQHFSLNYIKKIIEGLKQPSHDERIPVIVFTKNGGQWLEAIAESGCDAIGIDWMTDLANAKKRVGHRVALQGNMDPAALYGSPESIRQTVHAILKQFNGEPGHVFNLGHGIYPDVPPEHVGVMIEAVQQFQLDK